MYFSCFLNEFFKCIHAPSVNGIVAHNLPRCLVFKNKISTCVTHSGTLTSSHCEECSYHVQAFWRDTFWRMGIEIPQNFDFLSTFSQYFHIHSGAVFECELKHFRKMESALESFQMVSKDFDAQYHTTASSDCLAPNTSPLPTQRTMWRKLGNVFFF